AGVFGQLLQLVGLLPLLDARVVAIGDLGQEAVGLGLGLGNRLGEDFVNGFGDRVEGGLGLGVVAPVFQGVDQARRAVADEGRRIAQQPGRIGDRRQDAVDAVDDLFDFLLALRAALGGKVLAVQVLKRNQHDDLLALFLRDVVFLEVVVEQL